MHLKKLFNKDYFVQNILKSKAIISVCIGIIPILNSIMIMMISKSEGNGVTPSLTSISILNIIGLYILPIVISLCLFGYVFKKKSVDFVNSMPLSRKTIFMTNSIGGIIILVLMMLVNVLLLGVETLIFPNLVISLPMLLDYFIVWSVSYIFVFVAANLATSVTGNAITMLSLTAIILFFVPFMHSYVTRFAGDYNVDEYFEATCEDGAMCNSYGTSNITKVEKNVNYTLPYNYISMIYGKKVSTYSTESIVKMAVLSIVYFTLGYYAFTKRKMEVNETSFKSANAHMLLKSLTSIPLFAFAIFIIEGSYMYATTIAFSLVLLIAYYLIYDLITYRSIRNFKLGVIYFIATLAISYGIYYGINESNRITKSKFSVNKIQSVAVYLQDKDYAEKSYSRLYNEYLSNEDIVEFTKNKIKNPTDASKVKTGINIKLKTADGEYTTYLNLSEEEYNSFLKMVWNDNNYQSEYKNIDYSKVVSVNIGNINYVKNKKDIMMAYIKEAINTIKIEDLDSKYSSIPVDVNVYENHEIVQYRFPITISEGLQKEYYKLANEKFKTKFLAIKDIDEISWIDIRDYSNNNNNTTENLNTISSYENITKRPLYDYIKTHMDDEVDINKQVISITLGVDNSDNLMFFTNDIEGIEKITLPLIKEYNKKNVG